MQIVLAAGLIITAVILFYAQSKIDNVTLGRIANVIGIISGIAAIIVFASDKGPTPPSEGEPTSLSANTIVNISALKGWQDTGVFLENGERVEIVVLSGKWAYAQDQSLSSGAGDTQYICSNMLPTPICAEPLPASPKGALIGRIGSMTFEIGAQTTLIAQDSGNLQLRINDADDGLNDNTGSLQVNILK